MNKNGLLGFLSAFTVFLGLLLNVVSAAPGSGPLNYDLEVNTQRLDTYINEGSILRYQIDYHNNGMLTKDNVIVSTQFSPYVKFLRSDNMNYNATAERVFGGNDDLCHVDLLNETGVYMDVMNAWAYDAMGVDLYNLILQEPYASVDFAEDPFYSSPDMVGEFIQYIYNDNIDGLLQDFGIDPSEYSQCGYDNYNGINWNLGSVGSNIGGSITVYLQTTQSASSTIQEHGSMTASQNTIAGLVPAATDEGEVNISWTNNAVEDSVTAFLNKNGGPLLFDINTILDAVITSGMTEKETAVAVRQLIKDYTYNYPNPQSTQRYNGNLWWQSDNDYNNPINMLNTLYGMCGEINGAFMSLAEAAGLQTRWIRLEGHIPSEIMIDGEWAYMDADGGLYREDPQDGHIYSLAELEQDPSIMYTTTWDSAYGQEYYISLVASTGDNTTNENRTFNRPYKNMAFELYPQDTINYGYSLLNGTRLEYGEGKITRKLDANNANIIQLSGNSFILQEEIPYLIIDAYIQTDIALSDDVSVYLSLGTGGASERLLGNLHNRLGYEVNTPARTDNYYTYQLRFVCEQACDIQDIMSHITVESTFTFNTLAIPYDNAIDLYLTGQNGQQNVSAQTEYNTNNKIYISASISGDNTQNETIYLNDSKTIGLNSVMHNYAILPVDPAALPDLLLAKEYVLDDSDSLFTETGYLGDRTIDFHNTYTFGETIVLASEDRAIQALLPQGLLVTPSGSSCTANTLLAPQDVSNQFPEVDVAFTVGSPCEGTTLNLSEPVRIRISMDTQEGDVIIARVSSDGQNRTDIVGTRIDEHTVEIETNHFSYFQVSSVGGSTGGSSGAGGGGSTALEKDICPNGDNSGSYYDNDCGEQVTDNSEQEQIEAVEEVNIVQDGSCTNQEYMLAYTFGFENGITTKEDCLEADMDGILIRKHAAKFISNYAMHMLGKTRDTTKVCEFVDMKGESLEMKTYAIVSCQLGIMGLEADGKTPDTVFNPNSYIDKAMFATMLSRLLYGSEHDNNNGSKYREGHVNQLKSTGIITRVDDLFIPIKRAFALIMLMRTVK